MEDDGAIIIGEINKGIPKSHITSAIESKEIRHLIVADFLIWHSIKPKLTLAYIPPLFFNLVYEGGLFFLGFHKQYNDCGGNCRVYIFIVQSKVNQFFGVF